MTHEPDYYTVLGVGRDATATEIHHAYRTRARLLHPDVSPDHNGRDDEMQLLNEAWETLGTADRRQTYDLSFGGSAPRHESLVVLDHPIPPDFARYLYMFDGRLARHFRVGSVTFHRMSLSCRTADLSALDSLPADGLWRFSANHRPLHDRDLEFLRRFRTLEELDLGNTDISDNGLAVLADLPILHRLNLAGSKITDSGLSHCHEMKMLEELLLYDTRITDAGLVALASHPLLCVLDLRHTDVRGEGLAALADIPNLRCVHLPHHARHHSQQLAAARPDIALL